MHHILHILELLEHVGLIYSDQMYDQSLHGIPNCVFRHNYHIPCAPRGKKQQEKSILQTNSSTRYVV